MKALIKAPKHLTRKQQAFVQFLIDNPKASATKAAIAAYNTSTNHSAEVIANENLRKPEIMAELAKYDSTAQNTVIEIMQYSKEKGKILENQAGATYSSVGLQAANSLLDRLHGRAKQTVETSSTVVTLAIDLTGKTQ